MKKRLFASAAIFLAQNLFAFPIAFEHKFGTTVIEQPPERVATVDYAGADNLLALGFQPLTVRRWFGPYENGLWPWAQKLATSEPMLLEGDLNFEQIASTQPDLILAIRSGISEAEYAALSNIAPVVAVPPGAGDWDLTWEEQALLVGQALGREAEAQAQVDAVSSAMAEAGESNSAWQGQTFAMLTYWDGAVLLYTNTDSSVRIVEGMGLTIHPKVHEWSVEGQSSFAISEELLPELDADVLFWWAVPDNIPIIEALVARDGMRAKSEGREIILATDTEVNGALANGSLLSLPVAIERLIPMINAAVDGDPATEIPY